MFNDLDLLHGDNQKFERNRFEYLRAFDSRNSLAFLPGNILALKKTKFRLEGFSLVKFFM